MRQVSIVGGKAAASSVASTSSNSQPANAILRTADSYWFSGRDANGQGSYYKTPFPHLWWYEFPTAFVPGRISFRPFPISDSDANKYSYYGATEWQFIATNDPVCSENSAWTVLCEDLSGKSFLTITQSKYCVANPSLNKKYRCVGISVLNALWPRVAVSGLRMWEKVAED